MTAWHQAVSGSILVRHEGFDATLQRPPRTPPDKPEQPKSNTAEDTSADYN